MRTSVPIDFVFTWVNGTDPAHQAKREKYTGAKVFSGAKATRFNSCGEIAFGLKSIEIYAPWVSNIFIVTDDQQLPYDGVLDQLSEGFLKKIVFVDHKEIFKGFEKYLPVFNSRAIETVLWRIPKLSEQFVYFNDDVFINKPVEPSDFFEEGRPIHRGVWVGPQYDAFRIAKEIRWAVLGVPKAERRASFKDGQLLSAHISGYLFRAFLSEHTPLPALKSTLKDFFKSNPSLLDRNVGYRFRDYRQFSPMALSRHLEIASGRGSVCGDTSAVFLKCENGTIRKLQEKLSEIEGGKKKFTCISSLDEARDIDRVEIVRRVSWKLGFSA